MATGPLSLRRPNKSSRSASAKSYCSSSPVHTPSGGGFAPLPRSETKWGRLGGGGSQQQHPEQNVGEIRKLHHGPVGHALNQRLIVEYRLVQGHLQQFLERASFRHSCCGGHHPPLLASLAFPSHCARRLRSAGGVPPSSKPREGEIQTGLKPRATVMGSRSKKLSPGTTRLTRSGRSRRNRSRSSADKRSSPRQPSTATKSVWA